MVGMRTDDHYVFDLCLVANGRPDFFHHGGCRRPPQIQSHESHPVLTCFDDNRLRHQGIKRPLREHVFSRTVAPHRHRDLRSNLLLSKSHFEV